MALAISGITWIISYRCNLNCQHCFFDVKGPLNVLSHDLVREALNSLEQSEPLAWQHVSGGEPLLFEDELHRLLEVIQEHGSKTVGIASNGFWGETQQRAQQTVEQLKTRGVNGVCLSADSYHQKQVPIAHLHTAAEQVSVQGLGKHSFVVCCYPDGEDPPDEAEVFAIPFAPIPIRKIGKGSTLAVKNKADQEQRIPESPCRNLCCCLGETSPFEPQMVWIDPYGNVMICYGLIIGNLKDRSLGDVLRDYSVSQSPLLMVLAEEGPAGLYRRAVAEGCQPEGPFADECELCWQSRYVLRDAFPDSLGPDECYPTVMR